MKLKDYDNSRKEVVYFITLSTPDLQKNFAHHGIATVIASELEFRFASDEITLFSYCIMRNHAHILFSLGGSSGASIQTWVQTFKRHTEKAVKETTHTRRLWQGEFHDQLLRRETSLLKMAHYTLANPANGGIVSEWEVYPYSRLIDGSQKKH